MVITTLCILEPSTTVESPKWQRTKLARKNWISERVGCRLPWDNWTSRDVEECSSTEQLKEFGEQYEEIDAWSLDSITRSLGCLPNCEYAEYQLAKAPMKNNVGTAGIFLTLTSTNVVKMTEEIVYPVESFISEFGGALGLFLGFSLIMLWDWIEMGVDHLRTNFFVKLFK